MSRPALVIGLGGTGQWVLTWLKRDLLLSNNNRLPENVRLLSIDTASQLEASARSAARRDEEEVKLGGISLERHEFIYVGGDAYKLTQEVSNGESPNIGKWYHAKRWLDMLSPAGFSLDDGAGRIRQFGRLAIFKDLLGQQAGSKLWMALDGAIEVVSRTVSDDRRLEIIVVGSFAGGTGSGMFLDIALLLRMLANKKLGAKHILRGYFALPNVFTASPTTAMKARTFAAWRELNRFMVITEDFAMPRIEYIKGSDTFSTSPNQRIFDACYLVGSKRAGTNIASEAKFGAFPMVAEVISAILDEHAGKTYTEYILTNLAEEYATAPETPMYSAVGAYTVQVPVHYKQTISALQLAEHVVQALLGLQDNSVLQNVVALSNAQRHREFAARDRNLEVGIGTAGRDRRQELLSSETITYKGESARATRYTARVSELVTQAVDQSRRATIIEQIARAGGAEARGGQVASAGWVPYYTNLGDDPSIATLRRNIQNEVNYRLPAEFAPVKGETADETREKMNRIPTDVRKRYGGTMNDGSEFLGSFGDMLTEVQGYHLKTFRRNVRLHLLDMLNGRSEQDPLKAKSGKLGFAWDYFDGLDDDFEKFIALMDDVKTRREALRPQNQLEGLADNAKRFMQQQANRKLFWFLQHPNEPKSMLGYLQAQQRLVDLRREEIVHHFVIETAREMRRICSEARDTLRNWIFHLTLGDGAKDVGGVWSELQKSRKRANDDHSYDTTTKNIQRLVAETLPPVSEAMAAESLRRWEWMIDFGADDETNDMSMQVIVHPDVAGGTQKTMEDPTRLSNSELRRNRADSNLAILSDLTKRNFEGLVDRTTVAEEVRGEFPAVGNFANFVALGAEPLFEPGSKASARRKSNLIRVQASETDRYFYGEDGLEGILRGNAGLQDRAKPTDTYNIRVVNSEHPFKLTLVRTDDLYEPVHFAAWQECQDAYTAQLNEHNTDKTMDPSLMQNMSAEVNAVQYEQLFMQGGENYRPLHPRVVMLLENPTAVRQLLALYMMGMVVYNDDDDTKVRWELRWQKSSGTEAIWLTSSWDAQSLSFEERTRQKFAKFINAVHGYAVRGQTWNPTRRERVDYEFANGLIRAKRQELGVEEERRQLNSQRAASEGLIAQLRTIAYSGDVSERIARQDLADFARILDRMFEERLAALPPPPPTKPEVITAPTPPPSETGVKPENEPTHGGVVTRSRLDRALQDQAALEQFVHLAMLGFLHNEDNHWQLNWVRDGQSETLNLTPPSEHSWVAGFMAFAKGSDLDGNKIDLDFAARLIAHEQSDMGATEESELIDANRADEGLVGFLRKVSDADTRKLAEVIDGVLQTRSETLHNSKPRGGLVTRRR